VAQFARPDSDVSIANWRDQGGGATNIYSVVDEASSDDADYVTVSMPVNQLLALSLSDVTDPSSSSGHVVRWRARLANWVDDSMTLVIALRQTTTLIATCRSGAITDTSFTAGSYTLSSAEADAITDYAALRLYFTASGFTNDPDVRVEVSWSELEVPDVATGTATPALAAGQYRRRRG
jgi:hypothetical protein